MDRSSLTCDHAPTEFFVAIAQLQQGFNYAKAEQHPLVLCNNHGFRGYGCRRRRGRDPYEMLDRTIAHHFFNEGQNCVCGMYVDDAGIGKMQLERILLLFCPSYEGDLCRRY